jgi:GH35 family endo-1,4-beta-xylanase/peptidoglycan/xylan/chitin deacetylase (PgdA/CDA1 family)
VTENNSTASFSGVYSTESINNHNCYDRRNIKMKHKHFRRSAAGIMTGLMCMVSMPALPTAVFNTPTAYAASAGQTFSVGNGMSQHKGDNVDGYSYEIWIDQTGGSGSMTLGSGGSFNTEWSAQVSAGNFLARRGRNYDASKKATQCGSIVMDYAAEYSASAQGNSRLCVYGWMKDPLVEYYIIEDWVNWCPSANGGAQTVTIDGAQYEIFQLDHTGPTILGDTRTFKQYFSVRKQKRTSGTITVSDHFKAWEKAGWNIGNLTEVALNVEGWESSGKANVSKLTIGEGGGGSNNSQQPQQQPQQQNNDWNQWQQPQQQNNDWNQWQQPQQQNNDWNQWQQPQQQNNDWNQWQQPQQQNNNNTASSGDSLKGAFANYFKIGTSVSPHELGSGADFLKKHYSSITPENELKPDSILDQQACQQKGNNVNTQINLSRAAQTLKFCEQNGIALRGHTFVWYSQTPDWFFRENFSQSGAYVSKDIMNQRLESMIKNTFAALKSQYPNLEVYSYDVCNELFLNDGGGMRGADNSNWVKVYGDDSFVINAFKYARQYAPAGCKLYLNDYNEYIPAKTNDIYNMAMKLKALGYIDGIGMQSHLDTKYPDANTYETALKKFLSTGLEVQITELDITCTNEAEQASLYEKIFKLAMQNSAQIPAVTIWGTQDSVSWRSSQNPLLFKSGYQPKQAYTKVMALAGSGVTPASQPSVQTTTQAPVTQAPTTTTQAQQWNQQPQQQDWNQWNNNWNQWGEPQWNQWNSQNQWSQNVSMWGDANNSGNVDLSDAVFIMQNLTNPNKYNFEDQGRYNADVYQAGTGVTNQDANAVQRYLLSQSQNLPESYWGDWGNWNQQQPNNDWNNWQPQQQNNNNNNWNNWQQPQQQNNNWNQWQQPQQQNNNWNQWQQPQQQNNNWNQWQQPQQQNNDWNQWQQPQQQNNDWNQWQQPQQNNNSAPAAGGQSFSVGNGMNQHKADNVDGYSYEIWLDQTGGSGSMTLGSGGAFTTEWSAQVNAGNFLARRGRNYDASKKATQYGNIVMDYAADYSASAQGNSRLCVYGWMKDPLVEYYIIEDWVNWRPTANGAAQTVTIDGAEYEIFQLDHTGPTILGDTRTFKQYFSVRKQKRTSGTITVSDHFKAWEKAGWNIGNLTEVALNVEGWESSGKANVTKLSIGEGSGNTNNNTQQQNNNNQQNQWQQPQQQNNQWNQQPANTNVQVNNVQDFSGKKLVAISFDDGASATSRQDPAYRIMDALIKNNFHATFFYVGDWIKTNEQVQFAYKNGMEVANHTKSHPSLGSLGASEIRSEWEQCNSKLKSIIGAEPSHLMRLPYLDGGGQVKTALYDVPLISCGLDTQDWNGASADQIVNTIKSAAQNGTLQNQIVLCHENYASTAQAMETVLPWLKENGWEVVTVSDMFKANGKQLSGGQIYTRS